MLPIRLPAFRHSAIRRILPIFLLIAACALPAFAKKKGSGDFNADGIDDLCIGVPNYTVGSKTAAGAVNCIYGSHSGLKTGAGETVLPQIWTQDTDGVQGVSEAGDQFGSALAFGDFDGDGYADLCIGVPGETVSGVQAAGAVNCLYGSPNGLQANGDVAHLPQLWVLSTLGIASQTDALLGSALISGDFNHDGYSDLCMGIPGITVGSGGWAGEVVCIYGSAAGLQTNGLQKWSMGTAGVGGPLTGSADFGAALAAGDFNHDGYDDLCIGAYSAELNNDVGIVDCIYGSTGVGLRTSGSGTPASQYWHPGLASLKGGTGTGGDQFGVSLAVGDFNHDGYADLAIGSIQTSEEFGPGKVNVLYGSAAGLQDTGTGAPQDQLWVRGSDSVKGVSKPQWDFGFSLTAGDFNHDGYDDLCVGEAFDGSTAFEGGSVSCIYGSASGLQATGVGGPDDQLWDQGTNGVIGSIEAEDSFGWALSAGDFNGDGYLDLAIGVTGEDSNSGGINVLYGSSTGLQATGVGGPASQFWHQASDGVPGSGGGAFGYSLSH